VAGQRTIISETRMASSNTCSPLTCALLAGEQGILNVWDVNTAALGPICQQPVESVAGASAWSQLIGDSALLEELKNYFCYAQLLSDEQQDPTKAHQVTGE